MTPIVSAWANALYVLAAFVSVFAASRRHWSIGLFVFLILCNVVAHLGGPFSNPDSGFAFLVLVMTFAALPNMFRELVTFTLLSICWIAAGSFLFSGEGISGNPSMNGCLIAMTLPAAVYVLRPHGKTTAFFGVIAVASILHSYATVPLLMLVAMGYASAFCTFRTWPLAILTGGLFGVGFGLQGPDLFSSTGRFDFWRRVLENFRPADWFLGTGLGSAPEIFKLNSMVALQPYFEHAHNDWLELLVETGVVGLTSGLLVFGFTLKKSFNRPWLFASIVGYGVCAFFNFPAHLPIHAFVGCALVWLAWSE